MDIKILEEVVNELEKAKAEYEGDIEIFKATDDSEVIAEKELALKLEMELALEKYKAELSDNRAKKLADMEFEVRIVDKLIGKKKAEIEKLGELGIEAKNANDIEVENSNIEPIIEEIQPTF